MKVLVCKEVLVMCALRSNCEEFLVLQRLESLVCFPWDQRCPAVGTYSWLGVMECDKVFVRGRCV